MPAKQKQLDQHANHVSSYWQEFGAEGFHFWEHVDTAAQNERTDRVLEKYACTEYFVNQCRASE